MEGKGNVTVIININVPITLRIDIGLGKPVLTSIPVAEPVNPTLGQLQDDYWNNQVRR
jgi:hypothetical protein